MCVQTAVKALNVPLSGWVTTIFFRSRITPPPTGTSAVATSPPPAAGEAPASDGDDSGDDSATPERAAGRGGGRRLVTAAAGSEHGPAEAGHRSEAEDPPAGRSGRGIVTGQGVASWVMVHDYPYDPDVAAGSTRRMGLVMWTRFRSVRCRTGRR